MITIHDYEDLTAEIDLIAGLILQSKHTQDGALSSLASQAAQAFQVYADLVGRMGEVLIETRDDQDSVDTTVLRWLVGPIVDRFASRRYRIFLNDEAESTFSPVHPWIRCEEAYRVRLPGALPLVATCDPRVEVNDFKACSRCMLVRYCSTSERLGLSCQVIPVSLLIAAGLTVSVPRFARLPSFQPTSGKTGRSTRLSVGPRLGQLLRHDGSRFSVGQWTTAPRASISCIAHPAISQHPFPNVSQARTITPLSPVSGMQHPLLSCPSLCS